MLTFKCHSAGANIEFAHLDLTHDQAAMLLNVLMMSAMRYSFSLTGKVFSNILWKCPFTDAMLAVVCMTVNNDEWIAYGDLPVVALLLSNIPKRVLRNADSGSLPPTGTNIVCFLTLVLHDTLPDLGPYASSDLSMLQLMDSDYSYLRPWLQDRPQSICTALESILMLGLDDELIFQLTTARSITHWVIEWSLALHTSDSRSDICRLVTNAMTVAVNRTAARKSNLKGQSSEFAIGPRVSWLYFLWTILSTAIAKESNTVYSSNPEWSVELLRFCVDGVLLFLKWDHTDALRYVPTDPPNDCPHGTCTVLCYFRQMISRFVLLIREKYPTLCFDTDSWTRISSALMQTTGGIRMSTWRPAKSWSKTTRAHRDGVQRSVLEFP